MEVDNVGGRYPPHEIGPGRGATKKTVSDILYFDNIIKRGIGSAFLIPV